MCKIVVSQENRQILFFFPFFNVEKHHTVIIFKPKRTRIVQNGKDRDGFHMIPDNRWVNRKKANIAGKA